MGVRVESMIRARALVRMVTSRKMRSNASRLATIIATSTREEIIAA